MNDVNMGALDAAGAATSPLLEINRVVVEFPVKGWRRKPFRALDGVSLTVNPGETVGLVGESGSGKSTLGRAVLGLAPVSQGEIRFDGRVISTLDKRSRRELSKDIQVVFQDPYSSLNPAMTVQDILTEPLLVTGTARAAAQSKVRELLKRVHLPADAGRRLAREFSGGQRQRIAIARALTRDPRLIICDEPVSALDLSTQSRVLELFAEIQELTGVAYLFITHDLAVVRHISQRVAVMNRGGIVEQGPAEKITSNPDHPYTRKLLLAAPIPNPRLQAERRRERLLVSTSTL